MQVLTISALALALCSTPALASKTWWTLRFAQGIQCTGTSTGVTTGPGEYNPKTVCVPVPDYGFTGAVDWSVAPSSERSFTMGLHTSNDCSGDGGKYVGRKSIECIPLERTKSISVTRHPKKRSVTGRRAVETLLDTDEEGDEFEMRETTDLQLRNETTSDEEDSDLERRKNSCYTASFLYGAGVATSGFIYGAVHTCPATAKEENIHKGECGLSAVSAVMSGLVIVYSVQGLIRHGDQTKRNALILHEDTTLVDGFAVSYTPVHEANVVHPIPQGDEWSHYRIDHHDPSGKHANGTSIHSVHVSGQQRLTALAEEEKDEARLVARKAPAVAYYSWKDLQSDYFRNKACHSSHAADVLAEQLWNRFKRSDRSQTCASLSVENHAINRGEGALIRGTYSDQSANC